MTTRGTIGEGEENSHKKCFFFLKKNYWKRKTSEKNKVEKLAKQKGNTGETRRTTSETRRKTSDKRNKT